MQYFFLTLIFLFGTALGSFVDVIANRFNTGLTFFRGRSFCFSCNIGLQKSDLVPIFSFIFLKGKCQYCQSKIPRETIFVELAMGSLFVLAALKSGLLISNFSLFPFFHFLILDLIFAIILLISIYDLKHFIIPDSFLLILFALSFLYNLYFVLHNSLSYFSIFPFFLSSIILALPFLLIFLISGGTWFGFGDVKYIAVIGFLLSLPQALSAVVLSFWIGAVFAISILLLKRLKLHTNLPIFKNNLTIKSEIPFGPFLSLGLIISFYLNADIFQIHSLFNI